MASGTPRKASPSRVGTRKIVSGVITAEIRNTLEEYNRVARESDLTHLNACWGRRCLRVQRCSTGFIFCVTTHSFGFRQFLFFNREY